MDMTAFCGLDCEACPAFAAYRDDDQELRERTALEWQKAHDPGIRPEDINCTGCMGSGIKFSWCLNGCPIRKCALEMGVTTCGHCSEYPCDTVRFMIDSVPEAKERLDSIAGA